MSKTEALQSTDGSDGWCRVCGDGLALDCSNAEEQSTVCDTCRSEGFTGAVGDDVRRAIQSA